MSTIQDEIDRIEEAKEVLTETGTTYGITEESDNLTEIAEKFSTFTSSFVSDTEARLTNLENTEGTTDVDLTSASVTGILPISKGGTGNSTGNATTATTLATPRTLQTNLASTTATSFNGSANITPGVTGTLPITNGGTGNTTGNAVTATTLATARAIQTNLASTSSVTFNGSSAITPGVTGTLGTANGGTGTTSLTTFRANLGMGYGTCSTSASTTTKAVTLSNFVRYTGAMVSVYFTYASTSSSMMLNVNSTGASYVRLQGANIGADVIKAGDTVTFVYTGTYWFITSITNASNTSSSSYEIGDIMTTTRDLSSDNSWLACDGSTIEENDYPNLYPLLSSGTTWTAMSGLASADYYDVAYGDGRFVCTGGSGRFGYSTDGTTWTAMSGLASAIYYGVAYGDGKFVCVGTNGYSYYSTDGATWTAMSGLASASYYDVAYGDGRFVCVGSTGYSCYSVKGLPMLNYSYIKAL